MPTITIPEDESLQVEGITTEAPIQLPSDHPLVKTLAAQKETLKELRAKAARLDEIEEAQKTELQREREARERAEQALADRDAKDQAKLLAAEVAKAKSVEGRTIPASALRGNTREELEAHADEILALLPEPAKAPSADGQGKTGKPIGEGEMSADDVVAAATKR